LKSLLDDVMLFLLTSQFFFFTLVAPDSAESGSGPSYALINRLAADLSTWRNMLPDPLRWSDDDPFAAPPSPTDPSHPDSYFLPSGHLFTSSDDGLTADGKSVAVPYILDIQVALLRSRFYYAKYIVYRPFVYKALHFPDSLTDDDKVGVVICLRVCLILSHSLSFAFIPSPKAKPSGATGLSQLANNPLSPT
jgi:hypothetical protein